MARIRKLSKRSTASHLHPTAVDAEWQIVNGTEGKYLQLSTFGSDTRVSEPKVSQTIQIDRAIAADLIAALEEVFGSFDVAESE